MVKKRVVSLLLALGLMVSYAVPAYAGTWTKETYNDNTTGWHYKNDDGTSVKKGWKQIDGAWYYFDIIGGIETNKQIYTDDEVGFNKYGAPVYFVGSDGKMVTQGGFCNYTTPNGSVYSNFIDSNNQVVGGFFMVDNVLYYTSVDHVNGYTISSINTTFRGETFEKFEGNDGKTHTLKYIREAGKVLDLDGTPLTEADDENFFTLIKYIPKYNSQGQLIGEIRN